MLHQGGQCLEESRKDLLITFLVCTKPISSNILAPGAYSPTNNRPKSAPSWTMGARVVPKTENLPVSPASYNAAESKLKTMKASVRPSLRGKLPGGKIPEVPGPGEFWLSF